MRITISILLALVMCGSACKPAQAPLPEVREYQLKGRIESVDLAKKRAVVAHEEIKDYMKPMTMSFAVPDETVLKGLKSGDRVVSEGALLVSQEIEDARQGSPRQTSG